MSRRWPSASDCSQRTAVRRVCCTASTRPPATAARPRATPPRPSPRPWAADVLPGDRRAGRAATLRGIEGVLGRKLTWETDDMALQNIQARVRGAERLAAGQREERPAAGDQQPQRGGRGLCHDGRRHLRRPEPDRRHRQGLPAALARAGWKRTGPAGLHPIPALAAVNRPAADRRAASAGRRPDRRRRPDALRRARRHRAGGDPRQAARRWRSSASCASQFPQYDRGTIAPCGSSGSSASGAATSGSGSATPPRFHLDDENLDPKTWCRFPILSGGFERELEELRVYVESLAKTDL